eukprot:7555346-Alexandrium_andersonii.AAC.1
MRAQVRAILVQDRKYPEVWCIPACRSAGGSTRPQISRRGSGSVDLSCPTWAHSQGLSATMYESR